MAKIVNYKEMQTGDLLLFRAKGILKPLMHVISWLELFPKLPFKVGVAKWEWALPCHMAFAVDYHGKQKGWMIGESVLGGVQLTWLTKYLIKHDEPLVVRWFDKKIPAIELRRYMAARNSFGYDFLAYVWTGLQRIVWLLRKRKVVLPRLINSKFTCWENAEDMCRFFNKAWERDQRMYPFITDLLKEVLMVYQEHDIGTLSGV